MIVSCQSAPLHSTRRAVASRSSPFGSQTRAQAFSRYFDCDSVKLECFSAQNYCSERPACKPLGRAEWLLAASTGDRRRICGISRTPPFS